MSSPITLDTVCETALGRRIGMTCTGRQGLMKITDVKCTVLGNNPVVRIVTDEGVSGYGEVESYKSYLKPQVLHYKQYILGDNPTDVERVMLKIRHRGAFKPWGSAVSAIEMALWDIAGKVAGDTIGLALDCGPGWTVPDAIRLTKALEPLNLLWLEDLITGDYTPYVNADVYREVTRSSTTPIHTGEQIYLRQNFKELIERHAVNIVGPDPEDIGGLAELKWVAEYADLHGILMAPHGIYDGLIGLAGLVQVCATLPQNYIAFEYPVGQPDWWYDIITGLPNPIVKDGLIDVW